MVYGENVTGWGGMGGMCYVENVWGKNDGKEVSKMNTLIPPQTYCNTFTF